MLDRLKSEQILEGTVLQFRFKNKVSFHSLYTKSGLDASSR